ncbi:MAG: HalOD1 output domain-containing protein [Haloplanus sp.]
MRDHTSDDENRPDPARTADITHRIDETETVSEAVVRTVASLTDTPTLDLDPLYGVVDPEHLNRLFETERGAEARGSVSFRFNECRVTVTPEAVHALESDA